MTGIIRFKDLIVGQFYKLPSGAILKVIELTWHMEGVHKGKIKDLGLLRKDGTVKWHSFYPGDNETIFVGVVDNFDFTPLEIENQRLRKALEFYAEEKHYRPVILACGDKEIFIERDCGGIARKALEGKG